VLGGRGRRARGRGLPPSPDRRRGARFSGRCRTGSRRFGTRTVCSGSTDSKGDQCRGRRIAALRSFPGPGRSCGSAAAKGAGTSIETLADEVTARARHAVLNGGQRRGARRRTRPPGFCRSDTRALPPRTRWPRLQSSPVPGDVVLRAPGSYESFDQFRDFEDRGRAFGEAVSTNLAARPPRKGLMAARVGKLTEGLPGRWRWRRRRSRRRRCLRVRGSRGRGAGVRTGWLDDHRRRPGRPSAW